MSEQLALFTGAPSAEPIESNENYQALKTLVLERGLDPGTALGYMQLIYAAEAERLDKVFFDNDTPPALGFQYQQSIRHFKALAHKALNVRLLHFTELEQSADVMPAPLPGAITPRISDMHLGV